MNLRDISLAIVLSPLLGLRLAEALLERDGAYKVDLWHSFPERGRSLKAPRV